MNASNHTVTVPISDYNEMVNALKTSDEKFADLCDGLMVDLQDFARRSGSSAMSRLASELTEIINHKKQKTCKT